MTSSKSPEDLLPPLTVVDLPNPSAITSSTTNRLMLRKSSMPASPATNTVSKRNADMMSMPMPALFVTPTAAQLATKLDPESPASHTRLTSSATLFSPSSGQLAAMGASRASTSVSIPSAFATFSPSSTTSSSSSCSSALSLPMSCNFEALSRHFHLPLKIAAEKFGVRATAFKKRCRAIGIRHWPYRKVRSLKRSLQELGRCREEGILNEKQHHQLLVFQSQLDKLLSPETYGIDPSGRLPPGTFDDVENNRTNSNVDFDDDGDDDDGKSSTSNRSPRVDSSALFTDFKITTLRSVKRRKKSNTTVTPQVVSPKLFKRDFSLPSGIVTAPHFHPHYYLPSDGLDTISHQCGDLPSVSVRFASHGVSAGHGLPGFESYDPFFQDFKSEFSLTMEDFGCDDNGSAAVAIEAASTDDMFPCIRSPTMAALRSASNAHMITKGAVSPSIAPSQSHSSTDISDAVEDDVFMHISPDYGCLV